MDGSEIFFYAGIVGMAVVAVVAVVVAVCLARYKKRLVGKLKEDYGEP